MGMIALALPSIFVLKASTENNPPSEVENTMSRIRNEFGDFSFMKKKTKVPDITAVYLETTDCDLEVLSRQYFGGIIILVRDDGEITNVAPMTQKMHLPDQSQISNLVDREMSASAILDHFKYREMPAVVFYGLLSKWACAVLSSKEDVKLSCNFSDEQLIFIERVFDKTIKIPNTKAPQSVARIDIMRFAREIVRYDDINLIGREIK